VPFLANPFQISLIKSGKTNIVGLAVAVSCQGAILESYHGGLSNIDLQIALNSDTKYRVASISKSFTAAGLLKLMDSGAFNLDDDISDALGYEVRNPAYPTTPITYRMLLSHTSSLQDGSGYGTFLSATYGANPIPNISEVLLPGGDYFTSNMWRTEEPGSFFAYSNLNYGLIGTLIEALSGERFDIFMKTEILEPLGISGSYNVLDLPDMNALSVLYRDAVSQADDYAGNFPDPIVGGDYSPGTNGSLFAPQGGLRCSLSELMAFGHMLLNEGMHQGDEILNSQTVEIMLSEQWDFNGGNGDDYFGLFRNWGLGVHRAEGAIGFDKVFSNILMIGHPGEAYGLISDLYIDPASGIALAFVSNGYYSGGGYAFAENSIFYAPEEEAFEAIEEAYLETCTTLETENPVESQVCPEVRNGRIETEKNATVRIVDLAGRQVSLSHGTVRIDGLGKGIYLVEVRQGDDHCVKKISVY